MDHINIGESLKVYQINVEGASASKSEYMSRDAFEQKADVIVAQETHISNGNEYHSRGLVNGYRVVAYLLSPVYGSATYVRSDISNVKVLHMSSIDDVWCIVIEVDGIKVSNVYKPPNSQWPVSPIPINYMCHPTIILGDFNSHHTSWGYSSNDMNGTRLAEWCESLDLFLVFDAKDRASFFSARWQQSYNPDLCFVSRDELDRPMPTTRTVLKAFPRSQHRPIMVEIGTKIKFADSKQKPRWNFNKADWKQFTERVDAAIRFIPCEIRNYNRFIGVIKGAAKKCIPRGFRKRYIPGWTAEMEELFKQYEESNDPEIADELLELLMAAKRAKWDKSTSEMCFKHSSRKSWALLRRLVNRMLSNRYIRVFVNGMSSKYKRLKNGFAQGGVASPDYFNLYISDMPDTMSRKFPFADDLAMATQTKMVEFSEAEETLTKDMETMSEYYEKWRLCLNGEKTECCMFHLNNQMANVQLRIKVKDELIRHNYQPKYLGNKLDRPLTYNPLIEDRCQKIKSRNNIVEKISGTDWGANAHTTRTTALSLVYSTAEFAAPVWYKSAHADKIDVQLNQTMRIITGAVDSTPVPWLHVLSNIAPPHLRRESAAHREWTKIMEHPNLSAAPIKHDLMNPPPHRLTSRHPIWKDYTIQNRNFSIKERWKEYWESSPDFHNKSIVDNPYELVQGFQLPRREWKTLNRLRTGHGCCAEKMFLWNFADSPVCDCDGVTVQSMSHIVNDCPQRRFSGGFNDLHSATSDAIEWIKNLDLNL